MSLSARKMESEVVRAGKSMCKLRTENLPSRPFPGGNVGRKERLLRLVKEIPLFANGRCTEVFCSMVLTRDIDFYNGNHAWQTRRVPSKGPLCAKKRCCINPVRAGVIFHRAMQLRKRPQSHGSKVWQIIFSFFPPFTFPFQYDLTPVTVWHLRTTPPLSCPTCTSPDGSHHSRFCPSGPVVLQQTEAISPSMDPNGVPTVRSSRPVILLHDSSCP